MPTKWFKRYRETGQLTVFHKSSAWSPAFKSALATFNTLNFGVKLVEEKEEKSANIVVLLSMGGDSYPYENRTLKADFPADQMHGRARTLVDAKRWEIYFAVVFLPGKVQNVSARQKEVIIVHELIHAAGLNGLFSGGTEDPKGDHDEVGIMYPKMMIEGDGLIEMLHDKGAQAMTPIRVGTQTLCKMRMLWAGGEACKTE